jgi:hypothetical protein
MGITNIDVREWWRWVSTWIRAPSPMFEFTDVARLYRLRT